MLRGHACKFDFSSLALSQNWYSFLLCNVLGILLLGLTNKTCSLQVFRVTLTEIKASDEWRKIEYSCFLAVIYRFWNSFQTSEATTTRFFTAHQNVSGKHCQIAFYCRVTNKSSQTNHSCLRAERVYSVHERQTRIIFAHSPKICFQLAHSFVVLLWDFACSHRLIPTSWL